MAKYINQLCEAAHMMMDEYAAGELGSEDREAFEAHLRMCPDCRSEFDYLLQMKKLLVKAEMPFPEGLHEKIVAALAKERINQAKSRRLKMITRYSATAAGIVLILALGVSGIYRSIINRTEDNAKNLENPAMASITESETNAETFLADFSLKGSERSVDNALDEAQDGTENEETESPSFETPMMMAAPSMSEYADEAIIEDEMTFAYNADENGIAAEEAEPEVALGAESPNDTGNMMLSSAAKPVFAATDSMSSMLYDAPYIERVNDLDYVKALLSENGAYDDWYNNVWCTLTADDKADEPVLYRVIRDYSITRETIEELFLFTAPNTPEQLDKLYSDLILTTEYIDALYEDDTDLMRRELVNPFALYYNNSIYTYFWLVSCSNEDFTAFAPDTETLKAYAASMSQFFNTDALQDRLTD